jgi:hypothetical protein
MASMLKMLSLTIEPDFVVFPKQFVMNQKEDMAHLIGVAAAATLTEWSESTVRRRIADGSITAENGGNGRLMLCVDSIKPHLSIPIKEEEIALIAAAETGHAEAQNDLALIFLANQRSKSAIYWLDLAAKQAYPDAMHWLGRCYIEGNGVPKDENMGMMWLAKAAARGHVISQGQMEAMRNKFII